MLVNLICKKSMKPLVIGGTSRSLAGKAGDILPMPKCDFKPEKYTGIGIDETVKTRQNHMSKVMYAYYKQPMLLVQGHKQWLFDSNGRRYLDLFAGVATVSVGHSHPRVVDAIKKQAEKLSHTTPIYYYPTMAEYTKKLLSKFPKHLNAVFFTNSGSEANDLALFISRLYTGRQDVLALRHAYHGMSPYLMGVTAVGTWRYNLPTSFGVEHTMAPDVYRGPWGGSACRESISQADRPCSCKPGECLACDQYVNQVQDVLGTCTPKGRVAAFIAESIQGVGGTVQYPKEFIKRTSDIVKANGGLTIMDEVQTGFGRTGVNYWGFQSHNVEPDVVTMAKGIGNGFPMAAVVTRKEIADKLADALWFNTFGGNPLACAVGSAVLDVIDDEKLQQNSHEVGSHFINQLVKMKDEVEIIGDVRGQGLMIGVEIVQDKKSKKPIQMERIANFLDYTKDMGVLIGKGGLNGNVLRIKPPMCITKEDADFACSVIKASLLKI